MYVVIISFVIWGFFNFYMTLFKDVVSPIHVILILFLSASFMMVILRYFIGNFYQLSKKEIILNLFAGAAQSLTYIIYFSLLFFYIDSTMLIVIFYNLFGAIMIIFDRWLLKSKNSLIEYFFFILILFASLYLVWTIQNSQGTISYFNYNTFLGFIPALSAAIVGILYKVSASKARYTITSVKEMFQNNITLLFYRSIGGLIVVLLTYISLSLYNFKFPFSNITITEIRLGILYALFPFILSHFFYSIGLAKSHSILIISVLMNLSPIITLFSFYFYFPQLIVINFSTIIAISIILLGSSFLSFLHSRYYKKMIEK